MNWTATSLAIAFSLFLLNTSADSLVIKTHGTSAATEGWWVANEVRDAVINPGTDYTPMCKIDELTVATYINGCAFPVATIITQFSYSIQQPMGAADEDGTVYIEVDGVKIDSSEMTIGTGQTPDCDDIYETGDGDLRQEGESCTKYVSIDLPAGAQWQIGYIQMVRSISMVLYVRGVYN